MKCSIHIEAPVEKVFDFFKDPRNMEGITPGNFAVKDVRMTEEGVGTYYSWIGKASVLHFEGFDVYSEFVPNKRITDKSSSRLPGDWTFSFEPEGSGMQLTAEVHHRSFWRTPALKELVEWVQDPMARRFLSAVKTKMEN